jgi:2-polyprenyl-6-methoxyphenol hydroxylase-like FAD-dependent oxidoreductase
MTGSRRVAVVGAGPAGLTAALAARRRGLEVAVFEQAPDLLRVGGGIALQSNGLRALESLGVLAGLERCVEAVQRAVIEETSGHVLSRLDLDRLAIPQNRIGVVLRADLQAHLRDAAVRAGVQLHLGRRCTGIVHERGEVALAFADGGMHESPVVVAADGAGSGLRAQLGLRARRTRTGEAALRGAVPLALDPPAMREVWLPDGRRFGTAPLPGGRTYFYCSAPPDPWDVVRSRDLAGWIDGWRPHVPHAAGVLGAVPDWTACSYDELGQVVLRHWSRPPVFLIGDAAHAMTPDLGQGANAAMVDAVVLGRLIAAGGPLADVGSRFEALRRPVVRRTQRVSWTIGRLSRWSSPGARLLRRLLLAPGRLPPLATRGLLLAAGHNPGEDAFLAGAPGGPETWNR